MTAIRESNCCRLATLTKNDCATKALGMNKRLKITHKEKRQAAIVT